MSRALLLAALLAWASLAGAEEPRGYAELRAAWFPGAAGDKLQLVEHVRPSFEASLAKRVKLVATLEAGVAEGRDTTTCLAKLLQASALGPLLESAGCAPLAHANDFLHVDGAGDYLYVDRLFVDVYGERFDLRVGRQALNWGSARFFNPTDPFPQVLLAEPWKPRRGVNAVRLTVPFGAASDVMAVVAADDAFTTVRAAGRARVNWKGVDFAAVGAWRGDAKTGLVGLDVRGTAIVGFWLEGAWMLSSAPHEELAAGLDYSFPVLEQLTVFAQYSRNGAGLTNPDTYQSLGQRLGGAVPFVCTSGALFGATPAKPDPFAPFTIGRDYLLVGAGLGVTPEISVSFNALQNLNDGTAIVLPSVSWAAKDWIDVAVTASVPAATWGHGGEFKPRAQDLLLSVPTPSGALTANLSGLVPAATITAWTRASF